METTIILTGDINLMGVEDVTVPFRRVAETLRQADAVFGNLECCLYEPPVPRKMMPDEVSGYEGFYAPPQSGRALLTGGFHCVGNANNQNYGPEQIMSSNACLDKLGIPHVGTGSIAPPRAHRRSSPATARVSVSCSAPRSTGRTITKRAKRAGRGRDQGVHRLPAGLLQGRHAAAEPARHAAQNPDVVRSRLPRTVHART